MDIQTTTTFFMWCTLINIGVFAVSTLLILLTSDFMFRIHGSWFGITREFFNQVVYAWLGLYKLMILIFNLVPFLVLLCLK